MFVFICVCVYICIHIFMHTNEKCKYIYIYLHIIFYVRTRARTHTQVSQEDIDSLMQEVDINRNGAVEFDEFLMMIAKIQRGELKAVGGVHVYILCEKHLIFCISVCICM